MRSDRSDRSEHVLTVLFKNIDILAGPVVAIVYPMYASIRAVESRSFDQCQQWLTYWVLFSLITLFELLFAKVLEMFPIWPFAKLIATCWLVLPQFNGTMYVYRHFIRPFYMNPQTANLWYVPKKKNVFDKQDDILTAAEKYMERHGSTEFERIIQNRHATEARGGRNKYMLFDDDYRY